MVIELFIAFPYAINSNFLFYLDGASKAAHPKSYWGGEAGFQNQHLWDLRLTLHVPSWMLSQPLQHDAQSVPAAWDSAEKPVNPKEMQSRPGSSPHWAGAAVVGPSPTWRMQAHSLYGNARGNSQMEQICRFLLRAGKLLPLPQLRSPSTNRDTVLQKLGKPHPSHYSHLSAWLFSSLC